MNKRLLVLLGVAAGLLLVAVVLPKVLFSGDDGADVDLTAPASPVTTAAPDVAAEPGPAEPAPETFEVFSTKNPFMPLVATEPTVPTDPTGDGDPADDGEPSVPLPPADEPDDGGEPVTDDEPERVPTGASGGGATSPRPAQRVAVLEVFGGADGSPRTSVRVNDTVYEVAEGERFATSYQVVELAVGEGCGQFLFGDDRFRVCEGEELLK